MSDRIDEVIRMSTLSEILAAMTTVTERYKRHLDEGGDQKTYADAIVDIGEELARLAQPPEPELPFSIQQLRHARAT